MFVFLIICLGERDPSPRITGRNISQPGSNSGDLSCEVVLRSSASSGSLHCISAHELPVEAITRMFRSFRRQFCLVTSVIVLHPRLKIPSVLSHWRRVGYQRPGQVRLSRQHIMQLFCTVCAHVRRVEVHDDPPKVREPTEAGREGLRAPVSNGNVPRQCEGDRNQ